MSAPFAVNGPTPIYPAGLQTGITIKNTGTVTVYLSPSPMATLGTGMALGVGSSIGWDANNPLYAYATGGTLSILENAGNLFDAQAVAGEILAGGLAEQIADQIALQGAPTLDSYDILFSWTGTFNAGALIDSGVLDVAKYRSLIVVVEDRKSSSGARVLNSFDVWFYDGLGTLSTNIISRLTQRYSTGNSPVEPSASIITYVPIQGRNVELLFNNNDSTNHPNAKITVIGSYATRTYTVFHRVQSFPTAGALTFKNDPQSSTQRISLTGGTTTAQRVVIPSRNGRVGVTLDGGSSATVSAFAFQFNDTQDKCFTDISFVSSNSQYVEFIMPSEPVLLFYSLASGVTAFQMSIVYLD